MNAEVSHLRPRENFILRNLPGVDLDHLLEEGAVVDAHVKECVCEADQAIEHVYFPLRSVFSLVVTMDSRAGLEVGTVGAEGMVGLPVILGAATAPTSVFCQVAGPAVRVPAGAVRAAVEASAAVASRVLRFAEASMVQLARSAACSRVHSSAARASCWLLMTRDRIGNDEFPLTQEFLAGMVGVRRATASVTAGALQAAGLIRYRRGHVRILDRGGLEEAACECYAALRTEFDALLEL